VERRFSALVSIGLLALLSGCGGGGGGGGSPPPSPPPPPPADTTPDGFTFTAQTGADPSIAVTSNEVTITGINAASPVSITGGTYSINGGSFTSGAGSVTNGQRIQVRMTSSGQFLTASSASLTVGGVAGTFTATTRDADRVPNAIVFANKADAANDTWVASDAVTLAGFEVPLDISIQGGEYSIGGGAFTTSAGSVSSGQTLTLRARSRTGWSRHTQVTVTVGSVSTTFNVTTALPNYTPDDISFDGTDTVYLLSSANRAVFRWSVSGSHYVDPYELSASGVSPNRMAFSKAHRRLYLGYSSGELRYINVDAATVSETAWCTMTAPISTIGEAGNFIVVQRGQYSYDGGTVLSSACTATDSGGYYYGYSRATAWDPTTSRLYYTRDGISPNDLHYDVIDQTTGLISTSGETPYHGSYNIQAPIRVSANGGYVLLGSGDIYGQSGLNWSGSLGAQVTDARWFGDGSLATLSTSSNQTVLRRLSNTNLGTLEQIRYTGSALRVIGTDARMAVILLDGASVRIHTYVPSDDSDGDGVSNTTDAFPLDVAASADTDHDGYPDSWTTGRTQADSTTGLTLDSFPQDSACWLPAHGNAGACNYAATIPAYLPDHVVQHGDVVYLLSSANRRVYRWSISAETYLNPYVVGIDQGFTALSPTEMAVSPAHQRLYLGYASGAIRYIDLAANTGAEVPFANIAMAVSGLASVGNYVLAQDYSGAWGTHYILSSAGVITDSEEWNHHSPDWAWDPNTSRVYWFSMWSPSDLNYEVIDQATGQITSSGEAPYHGNYSIVPPIRVSQDGQRILLGSGDLYDQNGLTWARSLGSTHADARWMGNGSLVTASTDNTQTLVRRYGSGNLLNLEQFSFSGQALRIVGSDAKMVVVYAANQATQFRAYVPNDDTDGDGVTNTQDAFPQDRAASVDTDGDGYPDAWNAGRTQSDSTTGLSLDVFPQDSACWLQAHATGAVCDYGATVPDYRPDDVEQQGDIVYLLSSANRRVYRWSISGGAYLNPYVPGINQGFTTLSPTAMTLVRSQGRLYLGYANGSIRYIDVNAANPVEVPLANLPTAVSSLGEAGNLLAAQGAQYSYDGGYLINSSGTVTDQGGYYYGYSRETAWDANTSRLYYMRDGISPNDLHYDVIDQVTGMVTATGETPYHGDHSFAGVIRPSPNGQTILLGIGDFYNASNLNWSGTLNTQLADARWLANGSVATLTTSGSEAVLRRLASGTLANIEQLTYTGEALRVVGSDAAMVVLVFNNGSVEFHDYVPSDDSDGDGVQNTADAFPLDPAASTDTDHDGRPDAWNAGQGQGDSTTGLTLDVYPQDSACWQASHGSGGVCNPASSVPDYAPDQVVVNGDVAYLLSGANNRVYRWSIATGAYLNPYVVGINTGFGTTSPVKIAYSSAHQRLYLGYQTGEIRYLDANAANPLETRLTIVDGGIASLTSAGNFLIAQLGNGYYYSSGSRVLTSTGVVTDQGASYTYGGEYAFDPVYSRLYWVSSGYSTALSFEDLDQGTGEFTDSGNTQYNGTLPIVPVARVSQDGERIVIGNGDVYAREGLAWEGASLGKAITDAHWQGNILVDVDTTDLVEIRDATTREVLRSYQYLGTPIRVVFGSSEAYLVHVLNGTTAFVRLPFYDQDGDQIPRWWEDLYADGGAGMSDASAADAATDLDGDGVDNLDEYLNHSNPLEDDTDGDGLTDAAEINTWHTNPTLTDTDGDGLSDQAEVVTHDSDPLDTDSDDDGYTDLIEVLYGGDPNDDVGLPAALTSYTQTFEGSPNLAAWYSPRQPGGAWARDTTQGHAGAASYKSGAVLTSQSSATRFRGFFRPGQLTFWMKMDPGSCCNRMYVSVGGSQVLYLYGNSTWTQYTINVPFGVHEIEWRFERDYYGGASTDAAWIDDIVFTGQ
jgi:hypothetical protein